MNWIKTSERLPEEGVEVLAFDDGAIHLVHLFRGRWYDAKGVFDDCFEFTHWMPLPEPPKEVSE